MKLIATILATVIAIVIVVALIPELDNDSNSIDVIIIDGQSNAAPYPGTTNLELVDQELGAPTHNIYYYGSPDSQPTWPEHYWKSYDVYPIYKDGAYVIGSLDGPLAYYLSEKQGHDVLVINSAVSGSKISELIPGNPKGDWGIELIENALNKLSGYRYVNIIGWVWAQGEWDSTTDIDEYKSDFLKLDNYFDSIGAYQCYIIKTKEHWGNAVIAQRELVEEYPDIHMATEITESFTRENGMLLDGAGHYTQQARILVADSVADYIPIKEYPWSDLKPLIDIIPLLLVAVIIFAVSIYAVYHKD